MPPASRSRKGANAVPTQLQEEYHYEGETDEVLLTRFSLINYTSV